MIVTFYRQGRRDGGVRTGADVDGAAVLGIFNPGPTDADGSLDWFIDIEWRGDGLPREATELRAFLTDEGPAVRAACLRLGDRLATGIDSESAPFREEFDVGVQGASGAVFCSAIRRLSGRDIQGRLRSLADRWDSAIGQLEDLRALVPSY